ncbi:hypothetical protein FNZ56_01075 [Pseudoluteimonas lycopersici]|uniref:Uncharacterized protein n=1 Tax=Pseudoluteimonas lycopersici TaxID=1324796 RepID=A0A516V238_9GAMM|nr:hypothetical protein [Lysobacter lycopersici]QDQ72574.1 hypothetical protein FNZ56_01075 [Lysobacter lycopersici]
MPWWATLYFVFFAGFLAAWLKSEFKDRPERPYMAIELISEICLIVVALGYWLAPVRSTLGAASPFLFIAGLAWLLVSSERGRRQYEPDPELSPGFNIASVVLGVALYWLISAPLLYWGFSYGMLGQIASI